MFERKKETQKQIKQTVKKKGRRRGMRGSEEEGGNICERAQQDPGVERGL